MAVPVEPDHLSIMKGSWSQVTDEELNLTGLVQSAWGQIRLHAGRLRWGGGGGGEGAATDRAFWAEESCFSFR